MVEGKKNPHASAEMGNICVLFPLQAFQEL